MNKIGTILLLSVFSAATLQAETLALWENDNLYTATNSTPVDVVATDITASDLALGAGFAIPGATWENALDTYLSDVPAITNLSAAIANNRYYTFTVTPELGKQVDYENVAARITLNDSAAAGASVQVVLMSSVTGFTDGDEIGSFEASTLNGQITDNGLIDIDISTVAALQDQPSPVEFRLYVVLTGGSYSRVALGHIFFVDGADDVRVDGLVEDAVTLPTVSLAMWQFDSLAASGTNAAVDTVEAGVLAGDFAQSYRWFNSLANWPNSMWSLISDLPNVTNLVTAIAEDRYYTFTVKPDAGKILDYKNIAARITLNSAGNAGTSATLVLMSNVTGFSDGNEIGSFVAVHNPLDGSATDNGLINMDISGVSELQDITEEVEFRLYVLLNDENSNRMGFGHIFFVDGADDVVVEGTIDDAPVLPTKPATIITLTAVSENVVKMVVNAPDASELYYPSASMDLVNGGWSMVAHSDNGVNPFVITNLAYSTAEGTNEVIYLQADDAEKFFGVNEQ